MNDAPIKLNEKKRTYIYDNNKTTTLHNVVELVVRESGNHRLKTSDGLLHIIKDGWIHIIIEADDWTV